MSLPTYEYLSGLIASYEGSAFGYDVTDSFLITPSASPSVLIVILSELYTPDGQPLEASVAASNVAVGSPLIQLTKIGESTNAGGRYNRRLRYYSLFSPGSGTKKITITHSGFGSSSARQKVFHASAHAYYGAEVLAGNPSFFSNHGQLITDTYPFVTATGTVPLNSDLLACALAENGDSITNLGGTGIFDASLTYVSSGGAATLLGCSNAQRINPSTTTGAAWSYNNFEGLAGRFWETGLIEILSGERISTLTRKTVSVTKKSLNAIITEAHDHPQSVTLPAPKRIAARVKKLYTYKSNYDVGAVIVRLPKLGDNGFRRIKVFRNPKKIVTDSAYIGDLQRTPYLRLDGTVLSSLSVWADGTISQWNDLSGNGFNFVQSVTTLRPYLSRSDNLENFTTYSQQISHSDWNKAAYPCTVIDNDSANYAGDVIATKVTATATGLAQHGVVWTQQSIRPTAIESGQQVILEVDVKAGTYNYVWIGMSADSPWHGVIVDLSNGTFGGAGNLVATKTITSLGNGWYRVYLLIAASVVFRPDCGIWFGLNGNYTSPPNITPVGTETFYISRPQLRRPTADATYVSSTATPQYAGINGKALPYFASISSYMNTTFNTKLDIGVGDNSVHAVCTSDRPNVSAYSTNSCLMNTNNNSSASGIIYDLAVNTDGKTYLNTYTGSAHGTNNNKIPAAGSLYLVGFTKTNSDSSPVINHYINGVVSGTANQAATSATSAASNAIGIGNRASTQHGLRGFIGEIAIYPGISQAETNVKNKYLQLKYGLDNKKSTPPRKALTVARSDLLLISFQPKFKATYGAIAETPGYWLNTDGHLNANKYIQDSDYYQQFSYELQCGEPFAVFEKIMKKLLHPVGYKMFGKFVSESSVDNTISSVTSELTTDNVIDLP